MKRKGERKQDTTDSLGPFGAWGRAKGWGSEAKKDTWNKLKGGRLLNLNSQGHKKKKCSK